MVGSKSDPKFDCRIGFVSVRADGMVTPRHKEDIAVLDNHGLIKVPKSESNRKRRKRGQSTNLDKPTWRRE